MRDEGRGMRDEGRGMRIGMQIADYVDICMGGRGRAGDRTLSADQEHESSTNMDRFEAPRPGCDADAQVHDEPVGARSMHRLAYAPANEGLLILPCLPALG